MYPLLSHCFGPAPDKEQPQRSTDFGLCLMKWLIRTVTAQQRECVRLLTSEGVGKTGQEVEPDQKPPQGGRSKPLR